MVNLYHHFIANCAEVASSVTTLTGRPNGPKEMPNEKITAFLRLKTSLADAPMVDTFKAAIGVILNQLEVYHRQPLALFSKSVQPIEQLFSTFDVSCSRLTKM